METAVLEFMDKQGVKLEKITCMPLEGDGTIERRVEKCVLINVLPAGQTLNVYCAGYTNTF